MAGELEGRIGLITGAGSGIGRETALTFCREGARVAVADRHLAAAEDTVAALVRAGGQAVAIAMDVCDEDSIRDGVGHCVALFGGIDIAVNNAGIGSAEAGCLGSKLGDIERTAWDRLLATNLTGVWLCMKHEIGSMAARGHGVIVNIASIAGLVGFAGVGAYATTKHGVIALTKTAAIEYGQSGLRINAVCPGRIATPLITETIRTSGDAMAERTAMKRLGEAREIAEMVSWVASGRASYCTGSVFVADGGQLAG